MANLKDHQQAMVDLMASGSGIPASAMRLAHAMHDVLAYMTLGDVVSQLHTEKRPESTTSGLNDKALAADVEAIRVDSPAKWPVTRAERRVKELENTVNQLRASNAKLRTDLDCARHEVECVRIAYDPEYHVPEQAGCRKDDTQVCAHVWNRTDLVGVKECLRCGVMEIRE